MLVALGAAVALAGCGGNAAPTVSAPSAATGFTVTSGAFTDGGTIPAEFTCAGAGHRPPLAWTGDPRRAAALAVVVDDPDAPGGDFYHWVVVDLPAGTTGLDQGALPGGREITNSGGHPSWTPPCPPSGTHHYRFSVYGLSAPTRLAANASLTQAVSAIQKTAVVQGRLVGLVTHRG